VAACAKVLKPGGWAFFSTINRSPLSWLIAVFGAERVMKIRKRPAKSP
jgi:2-polyprenyl-6-hydroxyphenyl methylase/3-demethylubiquinone-9 3-methyltransferase